MLRWLGRLLIIGLILGAIGFAVSRLLGQDDDFDDFDDIEEGFEYTETPVEIDVPAEAAAPGAGATQSFGAGATQALDSGDTAASGNSQGSASPDTIGAQNAAGGNTDGTATAPQASASSNGTGSEDTVGAQVASSADGDSEVGLQEIKGIGPAYEQSLIAIGINHPSDLVNADPSALSEQLNVIGGQPTVEDWISQARDLASEAGSNSDSDNGTENNS